MLVWHCKYLGFSTPQKKKKINQTKNTMEKITWQCYAALDSTASETKWRFPEPSTSCPRGLAIASIFKLKRRIPSSNLRETGLKTIKRKKKKSKQIIKCTPRCKLANKKCQVRNQEGKFLQLYKVHFQKLIGTSLVLEKCMPRSRNFQLLILKQLSGRTQACLR